MHRLLTLAAVAATLVVVGCGGGSSQTTDTGAPARMNTTVGIKHVDGMGDVLVDASGLALYTPDQELNGKIECTGGCTSFWMPVKAGSAKPTAADGAGKLDVIRRPDGTRQVALGNKPLYTFVEDAPGKIAGEGFKDDFGGTTFTWHVVLAGGGKSSGGSSSSSSGSGSYGY
jgi:predicted lipoprotein with Yx(FWY)xxD motif